ncbi:3189_t:CDS:1, partial [Ambispora gerdemannii]
NLQVEQSQSRPWNSRSSGSSKTAASPTNYTSRGINNNSESSTTTSRVTSLHTNFNNNDNNNAESASAATIKPKKLSPHVPLPPNQPSNT